MTVYSRAKSCRGTYWGNDRFRNGDYLPGEGWVPDWRRRQICAAYAAGEMTSVEIAQEFDVSPRTVLRIARKYGLPPKVSLKPCPADVLQRAAELWRSNDVSRQQIADLLGVSEFHVKKALRARGYEIERKARVKSKAKGSVK